MGSQGRRLHSATPCEADLASERTELPADPEEDQLVTPSFDLGNTILQFRVETADAVEQPLIEIQRCAVLLALGIRIPESPRVVTVGVRTEIESIAQAAEPENSTMTVTQASG